MAKEILVVEELVNSITSHSLELQRLANNTQGHLSREFAKLGKELDSIASEFDASSKMNVRNRKIAQATIVKKGQEAIRRSTAAMQTLVHNDLIDIGNLEAKFSLGSLNRAVTGKGTIKFATAVVPAKTISNVAENLIIKGAPQKALWARQSVAIRNKFSDAIKESWLNNETIGQTRQRIRGTQANRFKDGILNTSRHHADSLARTSISSVANQVRQETYIANSDVVEGVQFLAVLDDSTTPICRDHSNNSWKYTSAGWKNMSGGQDYRRPPLHFNCRSTLIPLVYPADVLAKTVPAKMAKVPKDRARTMGKPLPRKAEFNNFDAWLAAQSVGKQKNVMGSKYALWKAGEISAMRVASQKGRYLTADELIAKYKAKKIIPEEVGTLRTKDNFIPNPKAGKEFKDALEGVTKAEFLAIEENLIAGKIVSKVDELKLGNVLRTAAPSELEFASSFSPKNFAEFLDSRSKRIAFYNHIAKNYEKRVVGTEQPWAKGILEKRNTGRLDVKGKEIDQAVVNELKEKIMSDTAITLSKKRILIEMFDEASQIVGSRRSLPMIESLFGLARKTDFDDIDDFVAYINNAMTNSVNSYFSRLKRVEVRTTLSPEKLARYDSISENAKDFSFAMVNRAGVEEGLTVSKVGEVRRSVATIGKREVRDFEGGKATFGNVDLELSTQDSLHMYLKYLSDDVRMSDKEIKSWMQRIRPAETRGRMTRSERIHLERVEFITKRTQAGDNILLTDTILKNPLFKDWADEVWKGRGLSAKMKEEVGQVLGDAQLYQSAKQYLKYSKGGDAGLDDIIKNAYIHSTKVAEKEVADLLAIKGKKLKEYVAAREAKMVRKLDTEDLSLQAERKIDKVIKKEKLELARAEAKAKLAEEQTEIIFDLATSYEKLARVSLRKPGGNFYREAGLIPPRVDYVELAEFVNSRLYAGVQKGKQYITVAKNLGDDFYAQYRNVAIVSEDEMIRMGHFLIEGAVRAKMVKRVKEMTRMVTDGDRPRDVLSWRLTVADERWKDSFLALKKNYGVDGLPSIGKAPKLGADGFYSGNRPAIRGTDRKWLKEKSERPSSKRWMDNLQDEADTGIRVNNYILEVMEELEKRGRSVIPRIPRNSKDVVARSKYDSYIRAKEMARGLQDEKFYNRMSADKFARTYADTTALQWQGDDINRGLMMFDRGSKLGTTGEADFARNFMNVAGFDKIPMQERLLLMRKIDDELILKTAKDPIKNDWWFTERNWMDDKIFKNLDGIDDDIQKLILEITAKANPADEGAFQFLAMIKERAEMIKWTQSGKKIDDFVSYLPSQRDGTTNVLQHLGGISRDSKIAQAVNMVPQNNVADAYLELRAVIEKISSTLPDDIKKWIEVPGLTPAQRRKSVKKALMTAQYNAGARTLGESYFDALRKVEVDGVKVFEKALNSKEGQKALSRLGKVLADETDKLFPEASGVRKALNMLAEAHQITAREAAKKGVKKALAIEFETPGMKFPFRQSYQIESSRPIKLSIGDKGEKMTLNIRQIKAIDELDYDDIDWAKQNRAFAPNIIHAMDATHKSLVVEALKKAGVKDFSMIHDSFGTHFGSMDLLLKETKLAFLEMYQGKNFMEILVKNFEKQGVMMKRFKRTEKGMRIRGEDGEWVIEDIPLDKIFKQGDYNFDDFMKLDYFFH